VDEPVGSQNAAERSGRGSSQQVGPRCMGRVGQRRSLSLYSCFRSKSAQAVEKRPGKAPSLEIALRSPLYSLPLRRLLIRFPTKVCLGQYKDGGQSNGLPEACGTKRFLETRIFMRTGKRATHHGSELGSIQKPNTFAQTISTGARQSDPICALVSISNKDCLRRLKQKLPRLLRSPLDDGVYQYLGTDRYQSSIDSL